ncbi:MAG TPA: hypothetical protein DDW30_04930 [Clostridiales bacterium]|nr:hypothetical protein [Clostridiales bacterium]
MKMDNRIIGKWYKDALGETLNIFGGEPPRMKMSFSSSGHYNFEPNCVYVDGDDLCFEINDAHYRMVYRVHYADGGLCGYYTQFGKKTEVTYARVSDVPEDGEYRYAPTEIFVPKSEKTRREILCEYADYQPDDEKIEESSYELCAKAPDILKKYDFDSYFAGIPSDCDKTAFAALAFVCDHFGHDGCGGNGNDRSIEGQIRFCEEHNGRVNCRGLAILLAALLRLKGIKARHITCMPYEEPFEDCHVVVDCELPSGERVMLDPTNRLYYTDREGRYVSLKRLRRMLIDGEALIPNRDASYNGGAFDAEYNRNYMTKNAFRFFRGFRFADGADERSIDLIPKGYVKEQVKGRAFTTNENAFWEM